MCDKKPDLCEIRHCPHERRRAGWAWLIRISAVLKQKLHHPSICEQRGCHQSRCSFGIREAGTHTGFQQTLHIRDRAALDRGKEGVAGVVRLSGGKRKTSHKKAQNTQNPLVSLVPFCGYFFLHVLRSQIVYPALRSALE